MTEQQKKMEQQKRVRKLKVIDEKGNQKFDCSQ